MLFRLARATASNPDLLANIQELKRVCRAWYDLTATRIELPGFDDVWSDFLDKVERVRIPLGSGPHEQSWHSSASSPMPPEACGFESDEVRRLLTWLRDLQLIVGIGSDIHLSSHVIAAKFTAESDSQVQPTQVWRWLRMFEKEGLLKLIERGDSFNATRYRYLGTLEVQIHDPDNDDDRPF